MRSLALILAAGLAACTPFPDLDATRTPGVAEAPYPRFVPIETLLDGPAPRADAAMIGAVEGRAEGLKTRAEGLRGTTAAPLDVSARLALLRARAEALRAE